MVSSGGTKYPREDEPGKPEVVRDPPLHLVTSTAVDDLLLKRGEEEELVLPSLIYCFPRRSVLPAGAIACGNSRCHAFQHSLI